MSGPDAAVMSTFASQSVAASPAIPPSPPAAASPAIAPTSPRVVAQETSRLPSSSVEHCLQLEPNAVLLHGVIERATFPAPPNYENVANGDAPETYWLLKLEQPTCVQTADDSGHAAHSGITRIQLVFLRDDHPYQKYRSLLNHAVQATGTLFAAQTGHHHTDVLLTVQELAPTLRPK
jgi:hypothetical protein